MPNPALPEFELKLSTMLSQSTLSVGDTLVALGVSIGRVMYGIEKLAGAEEAANAMKFLEHYINLAKDNLDTEEVMH